MSNVLSTVVLLEGTKLTRPQSSLIISLIILIRDTRAGAGIRDTRAKAGIRHARKQVVSLSKLTPAPFRDRETTGDESVAAPCVWM